MLESAIQKKIVAAHKKNGWFVTKLIKTSTNGIPDLLMIKNKRVVFIEVKSENKTSDPLQTYIQTLIKGQGIDVFETNDHNFFI